MKVKFGSKKYEKLVLEYQQNLSKSLNYNDKKALERLQEISDIEIIFSESTTMKMKDWINNVITLI